MSKDTKEVRVLNDFKNKLHFCHNKICGWLDDKKKEITEEYKTSIATEIVKFILTKKCITREVLKDILSEEPASSHVRSALQKLPDSASSGPKRSSKPETRLQPHEAWGSHLQQHELRSNLYDDYVEEQIGQKGEHVNLLDQRQKLEKIVRLLQRQMSDWKDKAEEAESNSKKLQKLLEESDRCKTVLTTTKADLEQLVKRLRSEKEGAISGLQKIPKEKNRIAQTLQTNIKAATSVHKCSCINKFGKLKQEHEARIKQETDDTFNKLIEENKRLELETDRTKTQLKELHQKFEDEVYNQVKKQNNEFRIRFEEEFERDKAKIKTLKQEFVKIIKETDDTFNKLIEENKRLKLERDGTKTQLNELHQKFKDEVYNQVKKQHNEFRQRFEEESERDKAKVKKREQEIVKFYETQQGEYTSAKLRIDNLLTENADLNQKCKAKDELLQKARKENQQLNVDIEQLQINMIRLESEILNTRVQIPREDKSEVETRTRSRSPQVNSEPIQCKQCWKYKKDISDLRKDVNSLRDRLSEAAGNKLRDNNPNIADLSDMNRPTSLAEKFGTLYNDEYTNAMEVIENKMSQADCVGVMLQGLKISYDWCEKLAGEQRKMLTTHSIGFMQKYLKLSEAFPISARCLIHVKEFQKKIAVDSLIAVGKICQEQILKEEKLLNDYQITKYIEKCSELCWMMHISDPPLCLKFDVKHGETLDRNSYNVFTKSGSKVDFLVWPVLYLHKSGPLLAKGVAQGM